MPPWIKIRKDIIEWEYWKKPEMPLLLVYLISSANTERMVWHGREIQPGQLITSRRKIHDDNPTLSDSTIRTCLKKLQEEGIITMETRDDGSIITICQFLQYCTEETQDVAPALELTPEALPQNKTVKSENFGGNIEKRRSRFYDEMRPYVEKYSKDMLRAFFEYWTEPNRSKTKMKFELEKTWDLNRRLVTWNRNQMRYGKERQQQVKREREERSYNRLQEILSSNKLEEL